MRHNHSMQKDTPCSKKLLKTVESRLWSTFESIVVNEVYQITEKDSDVVKMYNDVQCYVNILIFASCCCQKT